MLDTRIGRASLAGRMEGKEDMERFEGGCLCGQAALGGPGPTGSGGPWRALSKAFATSSGLWWAVTDFIESNRD